MALTPIAGTTHDITTTRSGTTFGWRVVEGTYKVSRANDFAPKISQGKPTHSDLDLWPTIDVEDFSHGIGQEYLRDDPARFYDSDGELETAIPNQVTLAAKWVQSDASFAAYAFADFGNNMYAGGASSVRKYDPAGDTWADSTTGLASPVQSMKVCFNKLYVGLGVNNGSNTNPIQVMTSGGSWASPLTGKYGTCFEVYKALLYFGGLGGITSYDGNVTYASIVVGDPQTTVTAMVNQAEYLVIFKDDGRIYIYDGTNVIDLMTNTAYSGNYKKAKSADGWIYFGVLSSVKRLSSLGTSPSLQTITPKMVQDDKYGWGIPVGWSASPNFVYGFFNLANNSYPALLKWNGAGWHVAYKGTAGNTANACHYSPVSGKLWVNDGSSRYQQVTTVNDTPYANYATGTVRSFYTCHLTAGFDDVPKMFRDIRIISENLTNSVKINLYYQAERDGTWVYFGSATQSPNQTIAFASGSAISATDLWIKMDFVTNDSAASPKLKNWHITEQTVSPTVWAIDATIRVDNHIELLDKGASGYKEDPNTATQLLAELMALSDNLIPVTLVGMDGITYQVRETNIAWKEAVRRDGYNSFTVPVRFLQALATTPASVIRSTRAGVSRWGVA